MIIKNATFITSASERSGFIIPDRPMIAVAGKSNVGKSSFINMLANQKKLARTSETPGRTRLVNYFDFQDFILADLPGYGFAKVSREEKLKWAKTLDDFFQMSEYISHVFSLVDIRHDPTADDVDMINYLHHYALPFTVIATKADKLSKTQIKPRAKAIGDYFTIGENKVIAVSNETRYNKEKVLDKIEEIIRIATDDFYNSDDEDEDEN